MIIIWKQKNSRFWKTRFTSSSSREHTVIPIESSRRIRMEVKFYRCCCTKNIIELNEMNNKYEKKDAVDDETVSVLKTKIKKKKCTKKMVLAKYWQSKLKKPRFLSFRNSPPNDVIVLFEFTLFYDQRIPTRFVF